VTIQTKLIGFAAMASLLLTIPALSVADEATDALWAKECASCHGVDGKANTKIGKIQKVKDLTDPEVRAKFDRARMIESTKNGILKADGKTPWMKAYGTKLSEEQIAALVDHVINDLGQ
jgi:cytochrome c553